MDVVGVIGFVSSVAGLVGFFLMPPRPRRPRVTHTVFAVALAILASSTMWYWNLHTRAMNVERSASALVAQRTMEFTDEGFIQASLAFLEKNKDLYPAAFERGQQICRVNNCTESTMQSSTLAHVFEGLLKGIGTIEGEAKPAEYR